jgi:hypothetical protein
LNVLPHKNKIKTLIHNTEKQWATFTYSGKETRKKQNVQEYANKNSIQNAEHNTKHSKT